MIYGVMSWEVMVRQGSANTRVQALFYLTSYAPQARSAKRKKKKTVLGVQVGQQGAHWRLWPSLGQGGWWRGREAHPARSPGDFKAWPCFSKVPGAKHKETLIAGRGLQEVLVAAQSLRPPGGVDPEAAAAVLDSADPWGRRVPVASSPSPKANRWVWFKRNEKEEEEEVNI